MATLALCAIISSLVRLDCFIILEEDKNSTSAFPRENLVLRFLLFFILTITFMAFIVRYTYVRDRWMNPSLKVLYHRGTINRRLIKKTTKWNSNSVSFDLTWNQTKENNGINIDKTNNRYHSIVSRLETRLD